MRLEPGQCRERFSAADHAVLAVNDAGGSPLVVPITFAVVQDQDGAQFVVFAVDHKPKSGAPLRRMLLLAADPRAAVLVEHYGADWQQLWWVRVDGRAEIHPPDQPPDRPSGGAGAVATDASPRQVALAALAAKYPQYVERPPEGDLVAIQVDHWSGWAYT